MPTLVYPASATAGTAERVRRRRITPRWAATSRRRVRSSASRRRAMRRSDSSWVSPGPRVPTPPPEPLEVLPHAPHALQRVLELGQLDLELALGGVRVLGEDVQDDRRAVDHPHLQRILERALLARRKLVVRDDHLCIDRRQQLAQLVELARPEVGARIGAAAVLDERCDRPHSRGPQELAHLPQLVRAVGARQQGRHHHPALGILVTRGVDCHEEQYNELRR